MGSFPDKTATHCAKSCAIAIGLTSRRPLFYDTRVSDLTQQVIIGRIFARCREPSKEAVWAYRDADL